MATGDAAPIACLQRAVRDEVQQRLADVWTLAAEAGMGGAGRAHVHVGDAGILGVVAPAVACHRTAARPLTLPVERVVAYGLGT